MLQVVIGACVYGIRNGRETRGHPHDDHHTHGPLQTGSGLRTQRMTDGDIALDRERRDGEDRSRRRHFGEKRLEETVRFAEPPRICLENRVQFRRQPCTHSHRIATPYSVSVHAQQVNNY